MHSDIACGNPKLYENAIADGANNVLNVLARFSPNVKGNKGKIDLSKTYTTDFVSKCRSSRLSPKVLGSTRRRPTP